MSFATFDPMSRLRRFCDTQDASSNFVGTLAAVRGVNGLSPSRLSMAMRGKPLDAKTSIALGELMSKLERLVERIPIPIRFSNAEVINALLIANDEGRLTVVDVEPRMAEAE